MKVGDYVKCPGIWGTGRIIEDTTNMLNYRLLIVKLDVVHKHDPCFYPDELKAIE